MEFSTLRESKTMRGILIGLGIGAVLMFVFHLGVSVGAHKARFSDRLGDSFERNFNERGDDDRWFSGMHGMMRLDPGGHGAVGKVVSVSLPTFVIAGPDNLERTVQMTDETLVREFRDARTQADVHVGADVMVLGDADASGVIEAKLIRLAPKAGMMGGMWDDRSSVPAAPSASTSTEVETAAPTTTQEQPPLVN